MSQARPYSTVMVIVFLTIFGLLAVAPDSTTIASPTAFTYDAPTVACVDVHAFGAAEASLEVLSVVREESARPSAEGRGTCTTPPSRSVATNTGRSALNLSDDVATQVDDAIARASQGQVRFPGHDGKAYLNRDGLLPERGDYTEWTAAASGAKRGADRVIIAGNPASPDAIYYWDHVNPPVRIGP